MQEIKSIEPKVGFKFEANGKEYVIEEKLSIVRALEATKLELELFQLSSTTIKNTLIMAYNDLNGNNKDKSVKFADASVKIHNLVKSLDTHIKLEEVPVLRYCALYINEKGEDRRTIDNERITTKITDWQEAGYDFMGFFLLVLNAIPNVRKDFIKYTEAISKKSDQPDPSKSDTTTSKK